MNFLPVNEGHQSIEETRYPVKNKRKVHIFMFVVIMNTVLQGSQQHLVLSDIGLLGLGEFIKVVRMVLHQIHNKSGFKTMIYGYSDYLLGFMPP